MPFPANLEAMILAGYRYARMEPCPVCREPVEVFSTPGGREIGMNPMCLLTAPAVRHYETCGNCTNPQVPWKDVGVSKPSPEPQREPVPPPAAPQIKMYGVTDKNVVACGWRDGTLEIAFRHGRYQYANVPEDVFGTLRKVPYPNNYFTKAVKNHPELYPFTKLS